MSLQQAFVYLHEGRYQEAIESFLAFLEKMPTSVEAHFGLARANFDLNARSIPMEVLERVAIADIIAYPPALIDASLLLLKAERIELAAKGLRKAIGLAPERTDIYVVLARCESALGNPQAAETLARHVLSINPRDVDAQFRLARALDHLGRLEEACAAYRAVLDSTQAYPDAKTYLLSVLYRAGHRSEAAEICRESLAEDPANTIALSVMARYFGDNRHYIEAERVFLALPRIKKFTTARLKFARAIPDWNEDARDQLSLVLSFWYDYGEILRKQGWLEQAICESRVPVATVPERYRPTIWARPESKSPNAYKVKLVSFSSGNFRIGQEHLSQTALAVGDIDQAVLWSLDDLRATEYYRDHTSLLSLARGAGYWAWKPYLIYNELLHSNEGDYVIYHDSGYGTRYSFTRSTKDLIAWCQRDRIGILAGGRVPKLGTNKRWTKRDCFLLMECDSPEYWNHAQIIGGFSIWRNSSFARKFVRQWMDFALDPRIITDHPNVCGVPNHEGFIDHRHDQSILTNLVVRHGITTPIYHSTDINGLSAILSS